MLLDILNKSKSCNQFLEIYMQEREPNNFLLGYPFEISNDSFIIASVAPNGLYDGYVYVEMNKVFRLSFNTNYTNNISYLYKILHQSPESIDEKDTDLALALLKFAYKKHYVVSIELLYEYMSDIRGDIIGFSQNEICIELLNSDGKEDGTTVIFYKDISGISCDTEEEAKRKLLAER